MEAWQAQVLSIALLAAAGVVGLLITRSVYWAITRVLAKRSIDWVDGKVLEPILPPLRLLIPVLLMELALPFLAFDRDAERTILAVLRVMLIGGIAWLIIGVLDVFRLLSLHRFQNQGVNDLHARSVRTKFNILQSIVSFLIVVIAIAIALMTFERVREVGVGLLGTAGIAGIILGFAAQRSLGTILAGIQIALAQPIRLGDVVVVENEFGTIEEITLTYVVVAIWDQRRIVLPITYFIEKPFINYTRSTSEILGTIFWYVDYRTPVEQVRNRFNDLVKASKLWDQRVSVLQVTNISGDTMELRGLVSAKDSGTAWDIRCEIREKLMAYLTHELPYSLPKRRAEVHSDNGHDMETQYASVN